MRKILISALVVGLLLTVGGLFVSAIMKAHQVQLRTQCLNNVKQIILSCEGYHDGFRCYPSDLSLDMRFGFRPYPADLPWERRHSWQFAIWPYIEAQPHNSWREAMGFAWDAPEGSAIAREIPPILVCPSRWDSYDEDGPG